MECWFGGEGLEPIHSSLGLIFEFLCYQQFLRWTGLYISVFCWTGIGYLL